MIKLEAIREVRYAGKSYVAGQTFTVFSEKDAKALKLIRKAKDAPPDVVPTHQPVISPPIETKVVVAEELPVDLPEVAPPSPEPVVDEQPEEIEETDHPAPTDADGHQSGRRRYRRRDMRSEV